MIASISISVLTVSVSIDGIFKFMPPFGIPKSPLFIVGSVNRFYIFIIVLSRSCFYIIVIVFPSLIISSVVRKFPRIKYNILIAFGTIATWFVEVDCAINKDIASHQL